MERIHELRGAAQHLSTDIKEGILALSVLAGALLLLDHLWWWILYAAAAAACYRTFRARCLRASLRGEVAVVAGAGGRLGRAFAHELARQGCHLALLDADAGRLQALEAALEAEGRGAMVRSFAVDVTDRAALYDVADHILREMGRVGVVVPLATLRGGYSFSDCPDVAFLSALDVRVGSAFYLARAFLPAMVDRNKGWLVHVAPVAAELFSTGQLDTAVAAASASGLFSAIRNEMKALSRSVRVVTCVANTAARAPCAAAVPAAAPGDVAARTVQAMLSGEEFVYVPFTAALLPWLRVLPFTVFEYAARMLGLDAFRPL